MFRPKLIFFLFQIKYFVSEFRCDCDSVQCRVIVNRGISTFLNIDSVVEREFNIMHLVAYRDDDTLQRIERNEFHHKINKFTNKFFLVLKKRKIFCFRKPVSANGIETDIISTKDEKNCVLNRFSECKSCTTTSQLRHLGCECGYGCVEIAGSVNLLKCFDDVGRDSHRWRSFSM